MRANARASVLVASPPMARVGPTSPVITIWPPTQTVAARTWRVRRTVSSAGASTALGALPVRRTLLGEGDRALHGVRRGEDDADGLRIDRPPLGLGHLGGALHDTLRV